MTVEVAPEVAVVGEVVMRDGGEVAPPERATLAEAASGDRNWLRAESHPRLVPERKRRATWMQAKPPSGWSRFVSVTRMR